MLSEVFDQFSPRSCPVKVSLGSKMEISQPSIGIFYISKMLALAPYATRKNSKGQYEIRRSWIFTVYSASLTVTLVFLTYRGLLFDANSKIPVRMKSATSKVVTALDVSVVVLAVVSGVYCGLFSLRETLELNARLYRVRDRDIPLIPISLGTTPFHPLL
ncbi:gustatory receptor for sugar taste 43a-like [Drosophila miranda]|uniref:gustatory receptor for sugar taste 43a-like n=1 Tax=Drosophila miranda TaxID=7229 RepID=UPI00143F8D10|nr:gustatory receptor for sugar taste 43a-like [Drosophila miranda]